MYYRIATLDFWCSFGFSEMRAPWQRSGYPKNQSLRCGWIWGWEFLHVTADWRNIDAGANLTATRTNPLTILYLKSQTGKATKAKQSWN